MEQSESQRRAAEGEAAQHSVQLGTVRGRRSSAGMWCRRAAGEEAASEGEAVPRGRGTVTP